MKEEIIDGINYRLDEETKTAEVTKKSGGYEGDIIIPDTVVLNDATYRVTSIGKWAFTFCKSLTDITIPDGVKIIGDYAFNHCQSLTSVTIPESVKIIGNCAFFCCESLPAITIPDSVKIMGESAFENCFSLKTITYIGIAAQWNNWQRGSHWNYNTPSKIVVEPMAKLINGIYYRLNKGKLTAKVIKLGSSERDIEIPKAVEFNGVSYCVTSIGEYAFFRCDSLTSVTIPDSVTNIEDYAFDGCISLTSITIPNGVTNIGNCAFRGCYKPTTIIIPESVTSIGVWAFWYCNSLTSITFQGTIAQWKKIEFGGGWNDKVPVKEVHCTDGDIEI